MLVCTQLVSMCHTDFETVAVESEMSAGEGNHLNGLSLFMPTSFLRKVVNTTVHGMRGRQTESTLLGYSSKLPKDCAESCCYRKLPGSINVNVFFDASKA